MDGVPQMEGDSSPGSSTDSNPELDALREEAAGYQTVMPGFGVETGPEPRAAAECPLDDTVLAYLATLIFDRLAVTNGAHWKLSQDEEKHLVTVTKPVIAKYFPAVMSKYGVELTFVVGVGMIVGGKYMRGQSEGIRKEA